MQQENFVQKSTIPNASPQSARPTRQLRHAGRKDDQEKEPVYPMPPGGRVPQLNLAGSDQFNVASGSSIQQLMPDPPPPEPTPLAIRPGADIHKMGIGGGPGEVPFYDPNFAGSQGVPPPEQVARPPESTSIIAPDFLSPDFSIPAIRPYDLTGPSIDARMAHEPDPFLPDITHYNQPPGLDIYNLNAKDWPDSDLLAPETLPRGLSLADRPDDMEEHMHLQLTPDVHMLNRPAELDPSALAVMQAAPGSQAEDKEYPSAWMDGQGMNSRRNRHMSLLDYGLQGPAQEAHS